jgi:hypothetical protein
MWSEGHLRDEEGGDEDWSMTSGNCVTGLASGSEHKSCPKDVGGVDVPVCAAKCSLSRLLERLNGRFHCAAGLSWLPPAPLPLLGPPILGAAFALRAAGSAGACLIMSASTWALVGETGPLLSRLCIKSSSLETAASSETDSAVSSLLFSGSLE